MSQGYERELAAGIEAVTLAARVCQSVQAQITPDVMLQFLTDPDEKRKDRVMKAMMQMKKLEIKPLLDAAKG